MLQRLGKWAYEWANRTHPWTDVYGLARSVLALSPFMMLLFNDASILFRPAAGFERYPVCSDGLDISLFCLVPPSYPYLNAVRWLALIVLAVVISGWRPRYTGILHWWIAYSLQSSAVTIDGGEQVSCVLTLLLLPVTLTDPRKWHWQRFDASCAPPPSIYSRLLALTALVALRVQVAAIYLHAGVAKLAIREWVDGTAVYYYLFDPTLGLSPTLKQVLAPILTTSAVVLPTWGTLLLELLLFIGLFLPKPYWRPLLVLGIVFHALIAVTIGIITFALAMVGALILFLRPIEKEFAIASRLAGMFAYLRHAESYLPRRKGATAMPG